MPDRHAAPMTADSERLNALEGRCGHRSERDAQGRPSEHCPLLAAAAKPASAHHADPHHRGICENSRVKGISMPMPSGLSLPIYGARTLLQKTAGTSSMPITAAIPSGLLGLLHAPPCTKSQPGIRNSWFQRLRTTRQHACGVPPAAGGQRSTGRAPQTGRSNCLRLADKDNSDEEILVPMRRVPPTRTRPQVPKPAVRHATNAAAHATMHATRILGMQEMQTATARDTHIYTTPHRRATRTRRACQSS